jgi:ABC-type nickel/cobalt efflux system permease component RcnA
MPILFSSGIMLAIAFLICSSSGCAMAIFAFGNAALVSKHLMIALLKWGLNLSRVEIISSLRW